MTSDRSAYATLGLRPGAGRAELNDAYRRLMKKYHPDRPGGDADRAAEINSAYTLLRRRLGDPVRVPVPTYRTVVPRHGRPGGFGRVAWLFTLAVVAFALLFQANDARRDFFNPAAGFASNSDSPKDAQLAALSESQTASFDEPVRSQIVDRAIADAIRLHSSGNLAAAGIYSSECQKSLRRERNLGWFDACTAFDEAMLTLNGDSPESGRSPFSESEVLSREISAAQLISTDSFGTDSHLHQVRSQVELQILPMLDSAAAAKP